MNSNFVPTVSKKTYNSLIAEYHIKDSETKLKISVKYNTLVIGQVILNVINPYKRKYN